MSLASNGPLETLVVAVKPTERKSAVLTPSSLACLSHIPTVNLTSGCAHGCLYCYSRGYSTYPGEGKVKVYTNTLTKLRDELARKRRSPRAVYFSPSSDLFQPVAEVLDMAYDVLKLLLAMRIGVAFLTKGRIPKRHMELLEENVPQVRGQIGLTTLNADLLNTFEPHAPPPDVRLAQAKRLAAAGIKTQVRLDPILPGLTDDTNTLQELCGSLAEIGVRQIAASTLFLRPAIVSSLKRHLRGGAVLETLLRNLRAGGRLSIHAERSRVIALPAQMRRDIYDRVKEIAKEHGIVVRLCACKNPDLATGSCSIAGDWAQGTKEVLQQNLFVRKELTDASRD